MERRLATIKLQLHKNPGLAQAIYEHCSTVDVDGKVATEYLLRLLPDIGVKAYRKLCPGLWKALPTLDIGLLDAQLDSDGIPPRRALFWGVVLRLDQLSIGSLPTTGGPFLEWCGLETYAKHSRRLSDDRFSLGDLLAGRMPVKEARSVLDLPEGVELTKKAINDAYKSLARVHHPDAGGDASKFTRITEAKDRLMLQVAA